MDRHVKNKNSTFFPHKDSSESVSLEINCGKGRRNFMVSSLGQSIDTYDQFLN